MQDSNDFIGTVLAGAAITATAGTVGSYEGRALAKAAVTVTGGTLNGCTGGSIGSKIIPFLTGFDCLGALLQVLTDRPFEIGGEHDQVVERDHAVRMPPAGGSCPPIRRRCRHRGRDVLRRQAVDRAHVHVGRVREPPGDHGRARSGLELQADRADPDRAVRVDAEPGGLPRGPIEAEAEPDQPGHAPGSPFDSCHVKNDSTSASSSA